MKKALTFIGVLLLLLLFFEPTKEGFTAALDDSLVVDKLQLWQGMGSFESYCPLDGCQP